jgi:anti-sigma B factor antagonist
MLQAITQSVATEISRTNDQLNIVAKVRRLDAATAREVKDEVEKAWRGGIQSVSIDLQSVEFIDSSGVGALLSIYKRLPVGTGSVKLINVHPAVQSVIELLRLHRVFELQA